MPVETNLGNVVDADGKPFDGLTALRSDFIAVTRFDKLAALNETLASESRLKQYIERRIKEYMQELTMEGQIQTSISNGVGFTASDAGFITASREPHKDECNEDTSDSHLTDALAEFLNGFNIMDGGTDE
jgi:hypothetical protein